MIGVIAIEGGWRGGKTVFGTVATASPFGALAVVPLAANEPVHDGEGSPYPMERLWFG